MKRRLRVPALATILLLNLGLLAAMVLVVVQTLGLGKRLSYYGCDGDNEVSCWVSSLPSLAGISVRHVGSRWHLITKQIDAQVTYCITPFNGRTYFGPRAIDRSTNGSILELRNGKISKVYDLRALYNTLSQEAVTSGTPESTILFFVFEGAWYVPEKNVIRIALSGAVGGNPKAKRGPAFYCDIDSQGLKTIAKPWGEMCISSGGIDFFVHPVTFWVEKVTKPGKTAASSSIILYSRKHSGAVLPKEYLPTNGYLSGLSNGHALFYDGSMQSAVEIDFNGTPTKRTITRQELIQLGAFNKVPNNRPQSP